MTYKVLVSPIAKAELLESTEWYNEQKNGLGLEFISEVEKSCLWSVFSPTKLTHKVGENTNLMQLLFIHQYEN